MLLSIKFHIDKSIQERYNLGRTKLSELSGMSSDDYNGLLVSGFHDGLVCIWDTTRLLDIAIKKQEFCMGVLCRGEKSNSFDKESLLIENDPEDKESFNPTFNFLSNAGEGNWISSAFSAFPAVADTDRIMARTSITLNERMNDFFILSLLIFSR